MAGNRLLSSNELEAAAAVFGANIFWVRQEEVRRRLQALPAVQSVRVSAVLPNRLEIRIAERAPAAVWEAAGAAYLVDERGNVLGRGEGTTQLTTVRDLADTEPRPNGDAVAGAARLRDLLSQRAQISAAAFEYSRDVGLSVVTDSRLRIHFGGSDDLEWKFDAFVTVKRELDRTGQRAELIDVRFRDRPYVR